jgi:hypothetical protein
MVWSENQAPLFGTMLNLPLIGRCQTLDYGRFY